MEMHISIKNSIIIVISISINEKHFKTVQIIML